jgi:hypothetical protein
MAVAAEVVVDLDLGLDLMENLGLGALAIVGKLRSGQVRSGQLRVTLLV